MIQGTIKWFLFFIVRYPQVYNMPDVSLEMAEHSEDRYNTKGRSIIYSYVNSFRHTVLRVNVKRHATDIEMNNHVKETTDK